MAAGIPNVSFADSLFYNLAHVIPYYTQGIFTRNRYWVGLWDKIHRDPQAVKFVSYLRKKYNSPYLFIYMLRNKSLLILDHDGIKEVLDQSPERYADAKLKHDGMSHFQPDAVTISRGEEWKNRRRFNETVLDYGQTLHQSADRFLEIVRHEVAIKRLTVGDILEWGDFQDLFEKISLQIIFGVGARDDRGLMADLQAMMRESNRAFALRKSKHFDPFYNKLRRYLEAPEDGSLVALCARAPADATTRVVNQIPHWMFAMNETLATNTARALALIVAHPAAEERVRAELSGADVSTAGGIDRLTYLEGCVQEAMRLWPTTPTLTRETVTQTTLGGAIVPAGTQVLILNSFNHRDAQTHAFADTFSPEIWLDGEVNYSFNHLSNGPQVCAGKDLVSFIAKAVLATLLSDDRYVLKQPALRPEKPMPYALNYFRLVFSRRPITEETMSPKKNKAVIRRWVDEGLNRGNLALAHETFAPDAPLHISGAPEGLRGPEGFIQFAAGFATGLPDIQFTVDDQATDGDIVVSRFHVTGTHTNALMGIPPTGKRVQFSGITYDRFADGKIAERWEVTDFFGLLQQLGAIPIPGAA